MTAPKGVPLRRKRIFYLDHTAKIGGGEIAIFNLVQALDKTKYEPIFVVASHGPLINRLRLAGIETYVLELDRDINERRKDSLRVHSILNLRQGLTFFRYVLKLRSLIKILDADLVHTNSLKSDIYGAFAARLAGIPVVWHIRDSIDEHYLPKQIARSFRALARILPSYVIANSSSTLEKLRLGRDKHASIVYSGISANSYVNASNRAKLEIEESGEQRTLDEPSKVSTTITMVGRIAEWKGQHIFIRAAEQILKQNRSVKFQIVGAPLFGEHDYEASLHKMCDELGVGKHVEFLGFREDVAEVVKSSDILVHASIIGEPFGQVVVEGMAAGKPVIATNGGALPEIVVEGTTGFLVEMGNVDQLAAAITRLLDDPEKARQMGVEGRRRALGLFTIDKSVDNLQCVYEELLRN
jgi:glycosyltransferase involved in cell wall biosynthesis